MCVSTDRLKPSTLLEAALKNQTCINVKHRILKRLQCKRFQFKLRFNDHCCLLLGLVYACSNGLH